jgi:nicotinate-nucleotide adenylyltransferase
VTSERESPRPAEAGAIPKRIGLFGGSFDPPHVAHQLVCTLALSVGGMHEVWLVPCFRHAFDKELASFADRMTMCRLAAEPFGERVCVCDVERELGGVSRTLVTLDRLQRRYPAHTWVLVMGADILEEAPRWYAWDHIQTLAELYVVGRSGQGAVGGVELPDVSSTDIRTRLRKGRGVEGLLPQAVLTYIQSHGLYVSL